MEYTLEGNKRGTIIYKVGCGTGLSFPLSKQSFAAIEASQTSARSILRIIRKVKLSIPVSFELFQTVLNPVQPADNRVALN